MFRYFWFCCINLLTLCSLGASDNQSLSENADSLFAIEEYDQAILAYKKLLVQGDIKEKQQLSWSINLAVCLHNTNQYLESKNLLQEIVDKSSVVTNDSLFALANHKLGVSYYYLNDELEAIEYWKKAIEIRKNIFPENHSDIVKGYRNIAASYAELDFYQEAKDLLDRSLKLHDTRDQKDDVLYTKTVAELGNAYAKIEDFEQAKIYLERAEDLYESTFAEEPWELIYVYDYFFDYYKRLEDLEKLLIYPQKVIDLINGFEEKYDEDYYSLADANNNLGISYDLREEHSESIEAYKRSIKINQQFGNDRKTELARVYNNLALAYRLDNRSSEAVKAIENAITINEELVNSLDLARNYENKADIINSLQAKPKQALSFINKGIALLSVDDVIIDRSLYNQFLGTKVDILYHLYEKVGEIGLLDQALDVTKLADESFNSLREEYHSPESKRELSSRAKDIYEKAVKVCFEKYQNHDDNDVIELAFEYIEKSKAITVLELYQNNSEANLSDSETLFVQKKIKIQQRISELKKDVFFENSSTAKEELLRFNRQLDILLDSIKVIGGNTASSSLELVSLSKIAGDLNVDEMILNYFMSDDMIYCLSTTKATSDFIAFKKPKDLSQTINDLREGIFKTNLDRIRIDSIVDFYDQQYVDNAFDLYQKLLKPIQEKTLLKDNIIIIPDDELGYIPFEALITEKVTEPYAFGSHAYLLLDHNISYNYSANMMVSMQEAERSYSQTWVGFAPLFSGGLSQDRSFALSKLDHNVSEVEGIAQILNGNTFLDSEATESNFLTEAPNYQIVHLATHGKANDLVGDYAYLAFTEVKDSFENEFLYNRDLYNLNLNAEMVVLSACETGIGELKKGEGIISLASGFSAAGAKSIITTLWSINDVKTKELMIDFYDHILDGKSKDNALRDAKLDFISQNKNKAHPFYWSAFIPIGDMDPIEVDSNSLLFIGLLFIGVAIISLLFFKYFFLKKS